jgi:hypothetical protein
MGNLEKVKRFEPNSKCAARIENILISYYLFTIYLNIRWENGENIIVDDKLNVDKTSCTLYIGLA